MVHRISGKRQTVLELLRNRHQIVYALAYFQGINEDPVNGSSGGALGAYLIHHNLVSTNGQRQINFKVYQSFAVGRKGMVEVEIELNEQGEPVISRITGDAVIVFKTIINV